MSAAAEHVAALLVHLAQQRGGGLSTFADELGHQFESLYGIIVEQGLIDEAYDILGEAGVVRRLKSEFAGDLIQVSPANILGFFGPGASVPGPNTSSGYDEAYDRAHSQLPILDAYAFGGQPWIDRVISRMKVGNLEAIQAVNKDASAIGIPASDRIVQLNHNQVIAFEEAIDQVSNTLSAENAIGGNPETRQRFLGQLAAGRELIRAGSVRAYLIYETLLRMLGTLIERYREKALGVAAQKLLELLIEHILGK